MKKTNNLLLFLLTSFVSGSFVVAKNPSNNKDLIESCHKKCKQIVKKLSTNIEGFKLEWQEKFNDSWKILNVYK